MPTITHFETLRIPVNRRGDWLLLRVHTEEGLVGLGDGSHSGDDAWVLRAWEHELAPWLIGRDTSLLDVRIAELHAWTGNHGRSRRAATAISAVEHALWDLQGKAEGRPIHSLLGALTRTEPTAEGETGRQGDKETGGRSQRLSPRLPVSLSPCLPVSPSVIASVRNQIPLYANINRGTWDRTPEGFAARAREAVAAGFDVLKCAPFDEVTRDLSTRERVEAAQAGIARVRAVREAVGDAVEVRVDCHDRFDVESAVAVAEALEPLRLGWFEAPTQGERPEDLAAVRARVAMPLATGETLYGLDAFAAVIDAGAADVLMPDVKQSGGLRECLRVAELCAARGVAFSPHNPAGPVATAISLHLCAVAPTLARLEYQFREIPGAGDLIAPREHLESGTLPVPHRPGLGVRWLGPIGE